MDSLPTVAVLNRIENGRLDLSPFVSYMMDAFERCLVDAALSRNVRSESKRRLLERMNKVGIHAEITTKKQRESSKGLSMPLERC